MKKLLIAIIIILTFNSCTDHTKSAMENNYFDLSKFLNNELVILNERPLSVLKTAIVNGQSEQHRYLSINWKRELESFFSADIHTNSFNKKYLVDTTFISTDSSKTTVLRYIANDEELKTRVLEIHFNKDGNVEMIKAELYSKNFIANLSESLIYKPGKFYSITNHEESDWFGTDEFIIEGQISKNPIN